MLKETGYKYVIFSIRDNQNLFAVMAMNAVFSAVGGTTPVRCVGSYKGVVENSWMSTTEAFDAVWECSKGHELFRDQESFLLVSECNKQYCELFYPNTQYSPTGQHRVALGSLHCVSKEEALQADAWTYRCDTRNFYVAKVGNPDRESPADAKQRELWACIDDFLHAVDELGLCGPHIPVHARHLRNLRDQMKPKWM